MDISITTFLLSLFVVFAMGSLLGYSLHSGLKNMKNRQKALGLSFRYKLVDYWFGLILTVATIFVFVHFEECVALSFTEDFNGMNLIFLVWIALLIFPMFKCKMLRNGLVRNLKTRGFEKSILKHLTPNEKLNRSIGKLW